MNELKFGADRWKLVEYYKGFYAAKNGIQFDDNAYDLWKAGYRDYKASLYVSND